MNETKLEGLKPPISTAKESLREGQTAGRGWFTKWFEGGYRTFFEPEAPQRSEPPVAPPVQQPKTK